MSLPPRPPDDAFLLHVSKHARLRLQQMGVDRADLRPLLADPEAVYRGTVAQGHVHQRGELAAVASYEPDRHRFVVHTVLWRTDDEYVRPDAP